MNARINILTKRVFQGNALLSDKTVGDNIALPLREVQRLDESTIRRKVYQVVREVALNPDRDLGLTINELSGGMAKRVAIARALALDPILLLYDEPTTGLDPEVAPEIQDLIGSVHRGKTSSGFTRTTFVITHDKEMLYRLQPRIVMLDRGHIKFDGMYEAFQNLPAAGPYFRTDAVTSPTARRTEWLALHASFAKSLCPKLKGVLPVWRKLFDLGL